MNHAQEALRHRDQFLRFDAEQRGAAFADIEEMQRTVVVAARHLKYHARQIAGQGTEAGFVLPQGVERGAALRAVARFAQFALDGGHQAIELVLGKIIVGARAHGGDGRLLVDHAGNDDEWEVDAQFLQQMQCCQGTELGHAVIGKHHVPGPIHKSGTHVVGVLDAGAGASIAGFAETVKQEEGVVLRILDDQQPQRGCRSRFLVWHAGDIPWWMSRSLPQRRPCPKRHSTVVTVNLFSRRGG